jgi:hypothetical protein
VGLGSAGGQLAADATGQSSISQRGNT